MTDTVMNHDDAVPASPVWQLDVEPVVEVADDEPPLAAPTQEPVPTSETPPPLERILEALLFVADEPLQPDRLCRIIRGLDAEHLQGCLRELNHNYRQQCRAYAIEQQGDGYRLVLRARHRSVVEQLYGGVKEARFSAAAVETLAVIAYRQPLTKPDLDALRGQDSDGSLRQLLRRGLVTLQGKNADNLPLYVTTPRFLQFFHLKKLDELPRADDLPVS
jgi:segregation and condensation protein B